MSAGGGAPAAECQARQPMGEGGSVHWKVGRDWWRLISTGDRQICLDVLMSNPQAMSVGRAQANMLLLAEAIDIDRLIHLSFYRVTLCWVRQGG